MSQEERYGSRDMAYSAWHRRNSTRRFIGIENAQLLAMIDADVMLWVEYDDRTRDPLALVETAIDVGQTYKSATVMKKLAARCVPPIMAFIVLYKHASVQNPADPKWPDIESFRVRRVWPELDGRESQWVDFTPQGWAEALLKIRMWSAKQIDDYYFTDQSQAA